MQCLLHCSGEPSADSLIPSNQSTTFFQTFISWHLVSGSPGKEMPKQVRHNRLRKILLFSILALACLYGIYAFIIRGVWKYLILQQQFFFFDLERGYIVFFADYIGIIILFATLSHLLAKGLLGWQKRNV